VHHVGILYDQFMMHGQRNMKFQCRANTRNLLRCFLAWYSRKKKSCPNDTFKNV